MASNITVYTMEFCPFCTRAKALLTRRGLPFKEILVPMDDEAQWDALEKKTGMKTMPMIFHGEKLILKVSTLPPLKLTACIVLQLS